MKRLIALLLLTGLLWGCAAQETISQESEATAMQTEATEMTQSTTVPAPTVPETTAPTEPPETDPVIPEDGRLNIWYDDRIDLTELTGGPVESLEIVTEEITSKAFGSDTPDEAVLYHDGENNRLIAVGTGLATVVADGTEYPVRVSAAPIDLVMIIGHSIGAGQTGIPAQSVKCREGWAYSTTLKNEIGFPGLQTGLGYGASERPNGIDAFWNGGVQGEASGLAWQWNQLTGEKIWILNAAVGGSCLPEWTPGSNFYNNAMSLLTSAQFILQREVAAGHYRLKDVAVLYHSAANFNYKQVTYDNHMGQRCYTQLLDGLNEAMLDIDGNGYSERIDAIGMIPCWGPGSVNKHTFDKPANYYMGALRDYPQVFVASMEPRNWCSVSDINKNFPQIPYTTQSEPVAMPIMVEDIFSDGTHLTQVAYNAAGIDIANHLYTRLRSHVTAESVTILTDFFMDTGDTVKLRKDQEITLILMPEPFDVCDLTLKVTGPLEMDFPFVLRANDVGTGTVTVSQGDTVLRTLTVIIE